MRSTRIVLLSIAMVASAGCGSPPVASPSVAATVSPETAGLQLRMNPNDIGCDTIGISYRSVTFEIDPSAVDPVTAITDEGVSLRTYWAPGFVGGPAEDPVVRDPDGQVVAADGDVLPVPGDAYPRLKGYFVCTAPDALYIFLAEPS
jgi:hypothetical protein